MKEELTGNQLCRKLGKMDGPRLLELLESYGYQGPFELYRSRFICISSEKIDDFSLFENRLSSLSLAGRDFSCFLENGKIKINIMCIRQDSVYLSVEKISPVKKIDELVKKWKHGIHLLIKKTKNKLISLYEKAPSKIFKLTESEATSIDSLREEKTERTLRTFNLFNSKKQPTLKKTQMPLDLAEATSEVDSKIGTLKTNILQFADATESSRDGAFRRAKEEEPPDDSEQAASPQKKRKG